MAREAVTLNRQLAEADPVAFLPHLAASLHTLARLLSDAGLAAETLTMFVTEGPRPATQPATHGYLLAARAAQGTHTQRAAAGARLRRLARARPDLATPLGNRIGIVQPNQARS